MWLKKDSKNIMKKNNLHTILLLLFIGFQLQAQEVLTIENALKIALENNFEICKYLR